MSCYNPVHGFRARDGKLTLDKSKSLGIPLTIACGGCVGCRLDKSLGWAVRCMHEASQHENNLFLTLTYNEENLPENKSLNHSHWQAFMKNMRYHYPDTTIRYYMVGEYGKATAENQYIARPHFHAIIFGLWPDDAKFYRTGDHGHRIYGSAKITEIWGKGFTEFGGVSFQSAAYCARYVMKKINGRALDVIDETTALKPYEWVDTETGEIISTRPEYNKMSLKPGIGKTWWDTHKTDLINQDSLHLPDGTPITPPKFYDTLLEREAPGTLEDIKTKRKVKAKTFRKSDRMLKAAEIIKARQALQLQRSL